MEQKNYDRCYVVSVDMGYGHQRAAYPFQDIAEGGIVSANDYPGISEQEKEDWVGKRGWYEFLSYFKKFPVIGKLSFSLMDYFQKIDPFYPRRDLSRPSLQQRYFYNKINHGLGKDLIERLNRKPLPLLTTFFVVAQCAEYYNYQNEIYCVACDSDVSRAWAPLNPSTSRIKYFAPNKRVKERLELYGVKPENIFTTGFPLPKENIGDYEKNILKEDLKRRIVKLDPNGVYRKKYAQLLEDYLGPLDQFQEPERPVTITFAVGGAGAQSELGIYLMRRLKNYIKEGKIRLNLVAGSRPDVFKYFQKIARLEFLHHSPNLRIIFHPNKNDYFKEFNAALRETDILWTKPSELAFYSGLGLPIIMSEAVGSQEEFNHRWLLAIGAGFSSLATEYVDEWLFDWLDSGWLAEAAMKGYLDAPKMGTFNIENIVLRHQINEIESGRLF
jgi:hypothetical protein